MKLMSWKTFGLLMIARFLYDWCCIEPRVDWKPSDQTKFESCPKGKEPLIIFGATSMLGRYIVDSFKEQTDVCLVSFSRSKCKKCDVNIRGDLRDVRLVKRLLEFYKPKTVMTSVKPPLLGVHYKTFIELNLLSMVQLIDAAKEAGVRNFMYVSSIAAAGHYFNHYYADEKEEKPFYTDYEAPYDVSKRFAEDYLMKSHVPGKFDVVALRTAGIIGGDGDPYDYMRWPVLGAFEPHPPPVDSNYAGNIADALVVVYKRLVEQNKVDENAGKQDGKRVSGEVYYYTGESLTETDKIRIVAEATNKPLLILPLMPFRLLVDLWYWAKLEPLMYGYIDLFRMGLIPQTFNQEKFHSTFPEFKEKYSMAEALRIIYGNN